MQDYRLLTNTVGHELKSVWSKKWLWLSIHMTHQQGEAKRLESQQDMVWMVHMHDQDKVELFSVHFPLILTFLEG